MNQQEEKIRELIALNQVENEEVYARHTFVEAGAGAGKTTLICSRICNLLRKGIYKPQEMVIITFTNKAATQLYDRIYKKLADIQEECTEEEAKRVQYARENIDQMCISTIHSFCNRILTEQVFYANRGMGFTLAEEADSEQMKKVFLQEWFVTYEKKNQQSLCVIESIYGRNYYKNLIEPTFLSVCDRFDEELEIPEEFREIAKQKTLDILEAEAKQLVEDYFAEVESAVASQYRISLANIMEAAIGKDFKNVVTQYKEGFNKVSSYLHFMLSELKPALSSSIILTNKNDYIDPYLKKLYSDAETFKSMKKNAKEVFKQLKDVTGAEYAEKVNTILRDKQSLLYGYVMSIVNEAKKAYAVSRGFVDEIKKITSDTSIISNDELLHLTCKLVQNEEVVKELSKHYRCYFVDEYQDTDHVQKEIIWKLTGLSEQETSLPKVTAFFVGDPKQSIYRFRGAEVSLFGESKEQLQRHPYADVYTLQYNFRSNEALISNVNQAFQKTMKNYVPMEVSDAGKESRTQMVSGIYQLEREEYESKEQSENDCIWLADLISTLVNNTSYQIYDSKENMGREIHAKDILVLLHTQSDIPAYITALNRKGIQVNASGKMDISEQDVLKRYTDIVGYLAKKKDSFTRAMAVQSYFDVPVYQLPAETYQQYVQTLKEELAQYEWMPAERVLTELAQRFDRLLSRDGKDFYYVLDARTKLSQMLETILQETTGTLQDYYETMCAYRTRMIERELVLDAEADAVRVMNIHKAKGLEAPIVIVVNRKTNLGFKEDSISVNKKRYQTIQEGLGNKIPAYLYDEKIRERAKQEEQEELVRLEYVTATRAGEALFLFPIYKGKKPLLNSNNFNVNKTIFPLPKPILTTKADETASISRLDILEKTCTMKEENKILTSPSVTPSGLETRVKKQRIGEDEFPENIDEDEEETWEDEIQDEMEQERPKGNIFGTVLHRFLELLANEYMKEQPENRRLHAKKIAVCIYQAILESSEAILEQYSKNSVAVMRHYKKFLLKLFDEKSEVPKRFEALLKDAKEIFTEFSFSYYVSEEEKERFDNTFSFCIQTGQKVWVNGTTDLIVHKLDGSYQIIDYKSDDLSNMTEEAKQAYLEASYGAQMNLYRYSVAKIFGIPEESIGCHFFHLYE